MSGSIWMDNPREHRRSPTTITDYHVECVREFSALKLMQSEISRRVGISLSSVARIQSREDIPHMSRTEGRAMSGGIASLSRAVLIAVWAGANTSRSVADATGLNRYGVSTYLARLERHGKIERYGRVMPKRRGGRPMVLWRTAA